MTEIDPILAEIQTIVLTNQIATLQCQNKHHDQKADKMDVVKCLVGDDRKIFPISFKKN